MITKGNWKPGKPAGTVVSDILDNDTEAGKYYGGELIAESIRSTDDAKLIAAAPELLEVANALVMENDLRLEAGLQPLTDTLVEIAKAAIKKATA